MKIQKITGKIKLGQENVKAENNCGRDCAEIRYVGSTSARGCRRQTVYTARFTPAW